MNATNDSAVIAAKTAVASFLFARNAAISTVLHASRIIEQLDDEIIAASEVFNSRDQAELESTLARQDARFDFPNLDEAPEA